MTGESVCAVRSSLHEKLRYPDRLGVAVVYLTSDSVCVVSNKRQCT